MVPIGAQVSHPRRDVDRLQKQEGEAYPKTTGTMQACQPYKVDMRGPQPRVGDFPLSRETSRTVTAVVAYLVPVRMPWPARELELVGELPYATAVLTPRPRPEVGVVVDDFDLHVVAWRWRERDRMRARGRVTVRARVIPRNTIESQNEKSKVHLKSNFIGIN